MAELFDPENALQVELAGPRPPAPQGGKVVHDWEMARLLLLQYGGTICLRAEDRALFGFRTVYQWLAYNSPHDRFNSPVPDPAGLFLLDRAAFVLEHDALMTPLPRRVEGGFRRLAEKLACHGYRLYLVPRRSVPNRPVEVITLDPGYQVNEVETAADIDAALVGKRAGSAVRALARRPAGQDGLRLLLDEVRRLVLGPREQGEEYLLGPDGLEVGGEG